MFEFDQEVVQNLLTENIDFKRLYEKHGKLKQQLEDIYKSSDRTDDITLGNLKKEKLQIKDKLATYVESHR